MELNPQGRLGRAVRRASAAVLAAVLVASIAGAAPADYGKQVRPENLKANLDVLTAPATRMTGTEGADQTAEAIRKRMESCGLDPIVETYVVTVPLQRTARLEVAGVGKPYRLDALWPNLSRTCAVHREGVHGHLVYGGAGAFDDFDGLDVEDSIALMEFASRDNMVHARILGAAAVVFIEPEDASRAEAEQKWLATPADLPRFWIGRADGLALKQKAIAYAEARKQARAPFEARIEEARKALEDATGKIRALEAKRTGAESAEFKQAREREQAARAAIEGLRRQRDSVLDRTPRVRASLYADVKWSGLAGEPPASGKNVWAVLPGSDEAAWLAKYRPATDNLAKALTPGKAGAASPLDVLRLTAQRIAAANAEKPKPNARLAWKDRAGAWAQAASAARASLRQKARPADAKPAPRRPQDEERAQQALQAFRGLGIRALCRPDAKWRAVFDSARDQMAAATAEWAEADQVLMALDALASAAADKPKHQPVVLQAHYDSISVVPTLAPGAEQACGMAALLELARVVCADPPKRSVVFLATSGHAQLLSGMSAWLYAHCLDEDTDKRITDEVLRGQIKSDDPVAFDLLLGLDLSTGSHRMGVFYQGHLAYNLNRLPAQAQPFYREFSNLLCGYARDLAAADDMAALDAAMKAAGKTPLAGKPRDAAQYVFEREETFKVDDLLTRMQKATSGGKEPPALADVEQAVEAMKAHGIVSARPGGKELAYESDPKLQNGITAIRGVVWTSLLPSMVSFDTEICAFMGLPGITLATINDSRRRVDTPHDLPRHVNLEALTDQARTLGGIVGRALQVTKRYTESKAKMKSQLRSFRGQITEFRIGKSVLADFPVPDVVVSAYPDSMKFLGYQLKTMTGVRTHLRAVTDAKGFYYMPQVLFRNLNMEPLRFDADTGRIVYAADRGNQGALAYALTVPMDQTQKRWRNVVFRCEALDLYGADDPRYLQLLNDVVVLGSMDFAPQRHGFNFPTGRGQTVYFEPGRRVKVILGSGVFGKQFLLTNAVTPDEAKAGKAKEATPTGIGYLNVEAGRQRSAVLYTPERVVRDTLILNASRMADLRTYGIENKLLAELQAAAHACYDRAGEARRDQNYGRYGDLILAARGYVARAYPDVRGTSTDTIKGLVFYFALLIPFSVFCERLLLAAADIRRRIAGVCFIFVAVFGIMYFAHPAFRISQNPWIIFVAFVLMAMSVFVISIVVSKFNEQVAQMRRTTSQVHETDVGRVSASVAAFNLGINNMRKRKTRTALTTVTLVLLMFTVLSFTSVETYTRFNEIPVVGARATYAGALLRDRNWNPMEDIAWRYCFSAFRDVMRALVPRAWFVSPDKDSDLHTRVERSDGARSAYVRGAVGLVPDERLATGIDQSIVAGQWLQAGDGDVCVLTTATAQRLGLDLKQITDDPARNPKVRTFGRLLAVRGILDATRYEGVKDLDGGGITPVDTTDIAARGTYGQQETVASVRENPTELGSFKHLPAESVLIVPFDLARDVGGTLRSIALLRPEGMEQDAFVEEIKAFMRRVGMTVFVSDPQRDSVTALSSLALSSFSGLQGLFIPIAIAALIVLNTMMGSVYERFKEIGIYSSVGLAPVHIAALFMAESCVYAVLGAISGYLIGQVVGTSLFTLGWLGGMTLNYSSLSAVLSTLVVMLVVIGSTLYPAKVASDMSVPDVTRRWRFPEPDGDNWYFDFPFTVASEHALGMYVFLNHYFEGYTEESVGSFYTDRVSFASAEGEYGTGYVLKMMVWIAPFDMGVSQWVEMRAVQTEDQGIARIQVFIHRETGEVSAWRRLNKGFLTDIRKQFLLWRTIPMDVKRQYAQEGRERLARLMAQATPPAPTR